MKIQFNQEPSFRERLYALLLATHPWPLALFSVIFALIISTITDQKKDPIDIGDVSYENIKELIVQDSARNGFLIIYGPTVPVTPQRASEIRNRPLVQEGFVKLQEEAPAFWGDLLYTDIYDFADFALKYIYDPDIYMAYIYAHGVAKEKMYVRHNPEIQNCATWYNRNTRQGIQYIEKKDIYNRTPGTKRLYRYLDCHSIYKYSKTDERFSHFSEDDRID